MGEVRGDSTQGDGVLGVSTADGHSGVAGVNDVGKGAGIFGHSNHGDGVFAESVELRGVIGHSRSNTGHPGVAGVNEAGDGPGVVGRSEKHDGVQGFSKTDNRSGVVGTNAARGVGVLGQTQQGIGVRGTSSQGPGVHGRGPTGGFFEGGSNAGVHTVNLGNGAAVHAVAQGTGAAIAAVGGTGGNHAGIFRGNVSVTGNVTTHDVIIAGEDCAEDFEIMSSAHVEPGTVMAIGDEARLVESHRAYDKRVAGIVSGAGDYKPGIILGKDASCKDRASRKDRVPLALIGKVFCKVDATDAPIEVGDLLTTSPTQGHAMKAEDPLKAFGAVVGKALAPLREGRSLLPILVALQ